MSIYTDFTANPNSENSFFSVPNVIARVSEIISTESTLLNLEEELKKYYIPAFTVDFTDNYVVVKVHPLGQEKTTIYISRTGTSEIEIVNTNSSSTADTTTGFSKNISGATKEVKVNPAIHADPNVKRPLVKMPLGDESAPEGSTWFSDNHSWQPIETIFLTSMPDNSDARTLKYNSMKSDLSIVLQIVADRMNTLDPEILENLKSVYREWVVKIEQLIEFLTLLSEQQEYLLEIIEWEKIIDNYLNLVSVSEFFMNPSDSDSGVQWALQDESLESLLAVIKDNLVHWHTSNWYDGLDLNGGTFGNSTLPKSLVYEGLGPFDPSNIQNDQGPTAQAYVHLGLANGSFYPAGYNDPVDTWAEDVYFDRVREKVFEVHTQLKENFEQIQDIDFSDVNSVTIKDWYAEEIDSILTGEESPARAEAWLANYETLSDPMIKTLKTFISGGSGLLVEQSILKAISDLSRNGIELADFLTKDENGNNWFAEVGSDTAIGLKSTLPYANPIESQLQSDSPPNPPIALSSTNYLNYALLIRYLRKIKGFFSHESSNNWFPYIERAGFRQSILEAVESRWDPDIVSLDDFLNYVGTTKLRTVWDPERIGAEVTSAENLWAGNYKYPNTDSPMTTYMSARQIIGSNWVREEQKTDGSYSKDLISPVVDTTHQNRYIQHDENTESYVPKSGPVNFWIPTTAKYDGWDDLANGANISVQNEIKNDFHVESAGSQINTVKGKSLKECVLESEWVTLADEWYKDNFRSDFDFGTKMKEKSDKMRVLPMGMYTGFLFCAEKPDSFGAWNKLKSESSNKQKSSLWKFAWEGSTNPSRGPLSWGTKSGMGTFSLLPNFDPSDIPDELEENPDNNNSPADTFDPGTDEGFGYGEEPREEGHDVPTPAEWSMQGNVFAGSPELSNESPIFSNWGKSSQKPSGFNPGSKDFFLSHKDAKEEAKANFGFLIPIEWKIFSKGRPISEDGDYDYVSVNRQSDNLKLNRHQSYFKWKGGGLQRIAGTLEGVLKYVYARSLYYLYKFISEEVGFSLDQDVFNNLIKDVYIHGVWWPIFSNTVERVYQDCKMAGDGDKWDIKINHEGRIVLHDTAFGNNLYYDPTIQRQAENTVGVNNQQLIKEYANFQTMVSSKDKITITSSPTREINWNSLYPLEILKLANNPNYLNSYGNFAQYAPPRTASQVRDPLCFTSSEIYTPGLIDEHVQSPYKLVPYKSRKSWMTYWGSYLQIQNLLENIDEPIRSFRDYIQDLEINEEVKEPYQEGLVTKEDISKSSSILKIFQENMELHQADNLGISNYWKSIADENIQINGISSVPFSDYNSSLGNDGGKFFIAVIGISDEFIEYTQSKSENGYIINLEYVTAGWSTLTPQETDLYGIVRLEPSVPGLVTTSIRVSGEGELYWQDIVDETEGTLTLDNKNTFAKQKRSLQNWLHLSKGYRLDEASFIPDYEQLYSDFLINNEAGIFPWSSSDFDGQRAIVNVETMYSVSPWLFPKNFYIDVVKARDFRYTVPVLIRVPIDASSRFQGNIKFVVTEVPGE